MYLGGSPVVAAMNSGLNLTIPPYSGTTFLDFTGGTPANTTIAKYTTGLPPPGNYAAIQNGALEAGYSAWAVSAGGLGADIRPASGTWDLSGATNLAIEVESDDRDHEIESMYFRVRIGDSGLTWSYDWNPIGGSGMRKGRRFIVPLPISIATLSGSAALGSVGRIMVYVYGSSSPFTPNPQKLRVLRIYKHYKPSKARLVMMFDDGQKSVYDNAFKAAGRMKDLGIPGTIYQPVNFIGQRPGPGGVDYMDAAQLDEVYAAGWDIGNQNDDDWKMAAVINSMTISGADPTLVTAVVAMQGWGNLAAGQQVTIYGANPPELNGVKTLLSATYNTGLWTITFNVALGYSIAASPDTQNAGYATLMVDPDTWNAENARRYLNGRNYIAARWPRAANHYAVSGGVHNSAVEDMLVSNGCVSNRSTQNYDIRFPGCHFPRIDFGPLYRMPAVSLDGKSAAQALAHVDAAIVSGQTIMIYTHGISSTYFTDANFATFIAGVAVRRDAGNLECLSLSQWWSKRLQG